METQYKTLKHTIKQVVYIYSNIDKYIYSSD